MFLRITLSTAIADEETFFYLETIPDYGMHSITEQLTSVRFLFCASLCRPNVNGCRSFIWDSNIGHCSLGVDFATVNGNYNATGSQLLYNQGHFCPEHLGYRLLSSGVDVKCVLFSTTAKAYAKAQDACAQVGAGGRLVRPNTVAWMEALNQFVLGSGFSDFQVFVGLDDLVSENTFVWSDGQTMTSAQRSALFNDGTQPDNYGGFEHCGTFAVSRSNSKKNCYLNDASCSGALSYVCEYDFQ